MSDTRAKILNIDAAPASAISGDGAVGVTGLPLLGLSEGTGQFDVRGVRIAPGGVSPDHVHDWVQANYVLSGTGTVALDGEVHQLRPGDFVYVPPNARHVFTATGAEELVLLAVRGPRVEADA